VSTGPESPTPILEFLREYRDVESPPIFVIGDGVTTARLLCGKLKVSWPSGLRRMSMPSVVKLGTDTLGAATTAARLEAVQICASGSGASTMLTRFAAMIFAHVLRNHPHLLMLFRHSASSDPIAHALQLIRSDVATNWSVASLARRVGMSRSNFAARFAAEVNRTPMEVVTERRMEFAAELLRRGELKIGEISVCVGYRSEEAFSRRFTRFFGTAPGQVRRQAQKMGRAAGKEV
jgi:AraC-like DNA-binding protein